MPHEGVHFELIEYIGRKSVRELEQKTVNCPRNQQSVSIDAAYVMVKVRTSSGLS